MGFFLGQPSKKAVASSNHPPDAARIYYEQMNLHGTPKFRSNGVGIGTPFAAQVLAQHRVREAQSYGIVECLHGRIG